MCLGIPMKITNLNGFVARCNAKGVERDVNLFMLQHEDLNVGDYVMVHVGYALEIISESDALTSWELYDQILAKETEELKNA